jgi:hypothetical protein
MILLLLGSELGSTDITTPQLDVENALHGPENLLVGGSGATLKVGDDGGGGVAAGGKILLGHLGLHGTPGLGDGIANLLADGVGLDDIVGAVDLGEALAFDCGLCGCVAGCVLLLSRNNSTLARSGVESALAPHDSLARDRLGSRGIPVIHLGG